MARRGQPGVYERTSARGTVSWQAVVDGPRNPDGSRRQIRKTFPTQRAARDWRQKTLHELRAGVYVEPSRELVRDYATHWLATRDVRASSRQVYDSALRVHVLPSLGSLALGAVTPRHITALFVATRDHGSRATIRQVTRSLFAQAYREGLIVRNPCDGAIGPPKAESKQRVRVWDAATLRRFLTLTEGTSRHALWWTLAATGIRIGEALALRWQDIDFEARVVRVERTLTRGETGREIGPPKTRAARREVTIDADTAAVLSRHRANQHALRLQLGPDWPDLGLVFTRADGGMVHPTVPSVAFSRLAAQHGLPAITLHGLRHTHAAALISMGRPLLYVSRRLGHERIQVTADIYGHLLPGEAQADAEAFASFMAR